MFKLETLMIVSLMEINVTSSEKKHTAYYSYRD